MDATTVAVVCAEDVAAEAVTNVMATDGPAVGLTMGMMYDLASVGSAANQVGVWPLLNSALRSELNAAGSVMAN